MRSLLTILTLLGSAIAWAQADSGPPVEGVAMPTPLQIALYDEAPFAFPGANGSYGGLMIEIWETIAAEIGVSYEYTLTDMDGLLSGLNAGRFDIGLGAITITPQREQLVDFSQPVNASGTGIIVPRKRMGSTFANYVWPITVSIVTLAAGLFLLLLVSGTLVWFVERHHARDPGHRDIDTIEDGLWWSAVTISTIGYGDKVPQTRLGRAIGVLWIFAGLVMLSLFTANASAIFTVTEIETQISTREDLRRVRVGTAERSSGQEYLLREHIHHRGYPSLQKALDALLEDEIDCVVSNIPVARHLNNTQYNRRLSIAGEWLLRNNMGIALAPHSPLEEEINQQLLDMLAKPRWRNTMADYLGEN
ncbi:MAG: transporter substrate-binding domain-containing protein [Pseudomonadota bacterium]